MVIIFLRVNAMIQTMRLALWIVFVFSVLLGSAIAGWKMTFSDEFNNQAKLDTSKWNTWHHFAPTIANSISYDSPDAFTYTQEYVRLLLEQREFTSGQYNSFKTWQYTSGTLTTKNRFSQAYGYFEVRARMPHGQGFWPSYWFLAQDMLNGGKQEIDVFEFINSYPYQTIHCHNGTQVHNWNIPKISDGLFHKYGLQWSPSRLEFYVDGVSTFITTQCVPNEPMYALITCGIGGSWPGPPNASTPFPSFFDIDYFRAYQYVSSGGVSLAGPGNGIAFSNPTLKPTPAYAIANPRFTPERVTPGSTVNATVTLKLGQQGSLTNAQLRAEIWQLSNGKSVGKSSTTFTLSAGGSRDFLWTFTLPSTLANGYYYLTLGLFSSATGANLYWENTAAMFGVGANVGLSSQSFPLEAVLRVSNNVNKTAPVNLQDANLSGKVYLYVKTSTARPIQQVLFYEINSNTTQHSTEKIPPYDYNGGDGAPIPFDASSLPVGRHFLSAVVVFTDGSMYPVSSAFNVYSVSAPVSPVSFNVEVIVTVVVNRTSSSLTENALNAWLSQLVTAMNIKPSMIGKVEVEVNPSQGTKTNIRFRLLDGYGIPPLSAYQTLQMMVASSDVALSGLDIESVASSEQVSNSSQLVVTLALLVQTLFFLVLC